MKRTESAGSVTSAFANVRISEDTHKGAGKMNRVQSVPQLYEVPPPPPKNLTYNELRQKCDRLEREVERLQGVCDHQHAIILGQQPLMAHLQWEASKWNHFKRIMEKEQGKAASAEAESAVAQRMAGLI